MPNSNRDYLSLLLNQYWFAPPVALWRAVELRTLAAEPFPRPILDLGCGDGLIAQILFADEPPVDMGFDPWFDQVCKAPVPESYAHVQQAQGAAMPYASGTFATVFSNSVLEHISGLPPVLREVARVLQPRGRFMATVPSDAFRRLLAGYRDRVSVGDFTGAEAYAAKIDQRLEHHRYPNPDTWRAMLQEVGLSLLHIRYYIPAEVEVLWDRANTTYGIHEDGGQIYRWIASPRLRKFGYQKVIRRWVVQKLSEHWRRAYALDVPEGGVGGGLLIVAEKAS